MTIAVDFDGVIHGYTRGWADGTIYDPPIPGAITGLRQLMEQDSVFIFTTREPEQVMPWLEQYDLDVTIDERCSLCSRGSTKTPNPDCRICQGSGLLTFWNARDQLLVTNRKLAAVAYLDDRAVRFTAWDQALTDLGVTPRLLDCGTCYAEWGEEVHPHPECPTNATEPTR